MPGAATRPVPSEPGRGAWWPALPLTSLVLLAFLPALGNGFVNWDDLENFLENYYYRGLGPPQIVWAWTTFLLGVYQPLAWMLLEAEYVAFGLDPRGYHLVSLALHAACTLSAYGLFLTLLDRIAAGSARRVDAQAGAALAAALFALHPLRVEAVAWVSCQPYLPSILAALLAVRAHLLAHPAGGALRPAWGRMTWILAAAAMLFKAVAVSLPVVLLIVDVYPLRRLGPGRWLSGPEARAAWREKLPLAAMSLACMVLALYAKVLGQSLVAVSHYGVAQRLAQACYAGWFYLGRTAWPAGLSAFYPLPPRVSWSDPRFWGSALALAAITAVAVGVRRRWPGLLAAWAAYLSVLAPNLGVARIGDQAAADRYSYAATLPLAAVLAYVLARLLGSGRGWLATTTWAVSLATIALLGVLSWHQCLTWKDTETLWANALARTAAEAPSVNLFYGMILTNLGRFDEAEVALRKAERLDPSAAEIVQRLGELQVRRGRYPEALATFDRALAMKPGLAPAYLSRGLALAALGRLDEATAQFAEAVRLKPDFAEGHTNLAIALAKQGKDDEAQAHFLQALRIKPGLPRAREGLIEVLRRRRAAGMESMNRWEGRGEGGVDLPFGANEAAPTSPQPQ